MDEPCSALDPTSTRRIEETILELAADVTVVIVTHNMQQAQRVSTPGGVLPRRRGRAGSHRRGGQHRGDLRHAGRPAHRRLRRRPLRLSAQAASRDDQLVPGRSRGPLRLPARTQQVPCDGSERVEHRGQRRHRPVGSSGRQRSPAPPRPRRRRRRTGSAGRDRADDRTTDATGSHPRARGRGTTAGPPARTTRRRQPPPDPRSGSAASSPSSSRT